MLAWARLRDALARHERAALVTIVEAAGSTPREVGARMVIHPDGAYSGTIGGGTLEWQAMAWAQAALKEAKASFALRPFALGPELGQCCGGRVRLALEVFTAAERAEVEGFAAREADGPFWTQGHVRRDRLVRGVLDEVGAKPVIVREAWKDGVLRERFGERRRSVLLFGAGHVGRALVLALAPLPFRVIWRDPRPEAFPAHVPRNVDAHVLDDPFSDLGALPGGSFVVIASHSHALDLALVKAALTERRFPYVGLIGSASKRARFERLLGEAGLDRAAQRAWVCPIGGRLDLRSKDPAVIAAATAVELLVRDEAEIAIPASQADLAAEMRRALGRG